MPRVEELELDLGTVTMKKPLMREMDKIGKLLSKAKDLKNEDETSEAIKKIGSEFCKDYMIDYKEEILDTMTTDDMWSVINWVLNKYSGGQFDQKKAERWNG